MHRRQILQCCEGMRRYQIVSKRLCECDYDETGEMLTVTHNKKFQLSVLSIELCAFLQFRHIPSLIFRRKYYRLIKTTEGAVLYQVKIF